MKNTIGTEFLLERSLKKRTCVLNSSQSFLEIFNHDRLFSTFTFLVVALLKAGA